MNVLDIDRISHTFGDRPILRDLSLSIAAGETVALLGANGSGKSTLLRLVAGLLAPSSGRIDLLGSAAAAGRPEVGIVFQEPRLLPWRTALRNVTLPLELAGVPLAEARSAGAAALARVGAGSLLDRNPSELSGGERGRAALARALVRAPQLLLLDEPFAALDAITRSRLDDELPELVGGASTLLVTHDVAEALLVADRVLLLGSAGGIDLELPGLRALPADRRRSSLLAAEGAALQRQLHEALARVVHA